MLVSAEKATSRTRTAPKSWRSNAASSGRAETVVDVIHARAFRLYAEGLRQYLSIRLGNVPRSSRGSIRTA